MSSFDHDPVSVVGSGHTDHDFATVDYGTNCLIAYKRVPLCRHRALGTPPDSRDYRAYHTRLYLPRRALAEGGIHRVILMIPGLNELRHVAHYDQLGRRLVERGFAGVLNPLPDHLWRHASHRLASSKSLDPWHIIQRQPLFLYRAYIQAMYELKTLVSHLTGQRLPTCDDSVNCRFYRDVFASDCRVSILGYSLGGLVALAQFVASQDSRSPLTSCFLLNSGAALRDINPEQISIRQSDWLASISALSDHLVKTRDQRKLLQQTVDWETFLSREGLTAAAREHVGTDKATAAQREFTWFHNLFLDAFLETNPQALHDAISKFDERIFLIAGGSDAIVSYEAIRKIEPPKGGLTVLKIPQMPHLLARSPEWQRWLQFIVDTIALMEEQAARKGISEADVLNRLADIHEASGFAVFAKHTDHHGDESFSVCHEKVSRDKRDEFYKCYYAGIANHDVSSLVRAVLRRWRAGEVLREYGQQVDPRQVQRAITAHPKQRVLEALQEEGVISARVKRAVLARQRQVGITPPKR